MRVINREVIIPVDCLAVAADLAQVALPQLIRPDSVWRDTDEQRAHQDTVRGILAEEGLLSRGALSEEFSATMTVLGRGGREFSAAVEAPSMRYALHVAASGRDAVFACYVPASGQVVLRPARPDALAEDLIAELPYVGPGPGVALSVPESDLHRAVNGTPPRRDVRRVLELAALPRTGGGQIYAGCRDGVHGYQTTTDKYCTFYDTEQGRYLFSFTEEPGYERYFNVAQGRPETLAAKTYELLDHLQRR